MHCYSNSEFFQAMLRIPRGVTKEQRLNRVEEVLDAVRRLRHRIIHTDIFLFIA